MAQRNGLVISLAAMVWMLAAVADAQVFEDLTCFKAKDSQKTEASVALDMKLDALDPSGDCSVKGKAKFFCSPTETTVNSLEVNGIPAVPEEFNGPTPVPDRVCYKVKCPKATIDPEPISDPFGTRNLEKFKVALLCVTATSVVSPKRVFITSSVHRPDEFGGVAGADSICQSLADGVGLGGTYKAWISDSTVSPFTSFNRSSAPYVLTNGTQIAADWDDLVDGTLDAPIDRTQAVGEVAFSSRTWTGTESDGTPETASTEHCDDWTNSTNSFTAMTGDSDETDEDWTSKVAFGCDTSMRFFCFEQ